MHNHTNRYRATNKNCCATDYLIKDDGAISKCDLSCGYEYWGNWIENIVIFTLNSFSWNILLIWIWFDLILTSAVNCNWICEIKFCKFVCYPWSDANPNLAISYQCCLPIYPFHTHKKNLKICLNFVGSKSKSYEQNEVNP